MRPLYNHYTIDQRSISSDECVSHLRPLLRYAVILAFDVKVERESQEMADSLGVRVFSAEIIYHLFDAFTKYREDYKKAKQDEYK